jgi:hypothetical protein
MNKFFEAKVKYRKTIEGGEQKLVTEAYLLEALSYTEAEAKTIEEVSAYISGEFKLSSLRVTNFSEVYSFVNADRWFKSKVSLSSYDEESGKEKRTNNYLLIQANNVIEAYNNTVIAMKGTMGDFSITTISETNLIDVFLHKNK